MTNLHCQRIEMGQREKVLMHKFLNSCISIFSLTCASIVNHESFLSPLNILYPLTSKITFSMRKNQLSLAYFFVNVSYSKSIQVISFVDSQI